MNFSSDILITIAIVAIVVLLVIGLIKKTLWMCIIAAVIAAVCFVTQPGKLADFKESVVDMFDGSIEPLKGDDYSDIIDDLDTVTQNDN